MSASMPSAAAASTTSSTVANIARVKAIAAGLPCRAA
jgi:hypothetical protein